MAVAARSVAPAESPIASAKGATDTGDRIFHTLVIVAASLVPILLVAIVVLLALDAMPATGETTAASLAPSASAS